MSGSWWVKHANQMQWAVLLQIVVRRLPTIGKSVVYVTDAYIHLPVAHYYMLSLTCYVDEKCPKENDFTEKWTVGIHHGIQNSFRTYFR